MKITIQADILNTHIHTHTHAHAQTYTHTRIYTHTHIHTHIQTHIHTHTHTQGESLLVVINPNMYKPGSYLLAVQSLKTPTHTHKTDIEKHRFIHIHTQRGKIDANLQHT
eukprot:GHVQ01034248.1.p3 GENE.GHVQ01034248.1~~GHVQ01034248.1.p3  ORF type:complete len:110 (-),score=28.50 GHVQ01034248.1:74-403(-)